MPSHQPPTANLIPTKSFDPRRPAHRLLLLALILIGFALRLFHLGGESLWYDETVSAYLATQSVTELVAHTARDIHPPAYYLLLHLWQSIAHPTVAFGLEYLYAWPSLCLSILVLVLTFAIVKRCFGTKPAIWALALALFHPTQIWFAQEVRMYALGAFWLLLTLWAVSPYLNHRSVNNRNANSKIGDLPKSGLILYPLAALGGLYTLYYFLFWLAILNFAMLIRLWKQGHALRSWIVLQIIVLVGWLPWLPIFIRQTITPPVPGWRVPWQNASEMIASLSEGVGALWVGHTPPLLLTWPWALLIVAIALAFYGYTKGLGRSSRLIWLLLGFGSPLILFVMSLIGPPIYHVRYMSTYAPLVIILVAALLANLRRAIAAPLYIALAVISALTLQQLWTNPRYASDDHRHAAATLAQAWRPGDAILVNAGWAYTAIAVYWPTELPSPDTARPPDLAESVRLTELTTLPQGDMSNAPTLVRTGSVDGDATLGWGLPVSDFYAISEAETLDTLAQLAATHSTIWHYRLYDTVSDPNGVIRDWLTHNTQLFYSQPVPGRDYLLLEGYRTLQPSVPALSDIEINFPDAALTLLGTSHPAQLPAGETLYVNLAWRFASVSTPAINPSLSLRLYDSQGNFLLQSDTTLTANPGGDSSQSLALPIPADTIPGDYTVSLVVYTPDTLAPYAALAKDGSALTSPIAIGNLSIGLPTTIPNPNAPQATFDYIDLVAHELPATPLAPGAAVDTTWIWRPQPNTYQDRYIGHLELVDNNTQHIPLADFTLGGDNYPSSAWPANYPVKQRLSSLLPTSLPAGSYRLYLSVTLATDGALINARVPWQFGQKSAIEVGEIQIEATN